MAKVTQSELDYRSSIVPDDWYKEEFDEKYAFLPVLKDDEITQALRKKVEEKGAAYFAKKLSLTEKTINAWAEIKGKSLKKQFCPEEWLVLHEELGIERELIVDKRQIEDNARKRSIKKYVEEHKLGFYDSDLLGLESCEALLHYIYRHPHSLQKVADQIGIDVKHLRSNSNDPIYPEMRVGMTVKEKIRTVCNETWPDAMKMREVYQEYMEEGDEAFICDTDDDFTPKRKKSKKNDPEGCGTAAVLCIGGIIALLMLI